ncbi:hypothetical protein ACNKHQ_00600 [Shigella flexneri]
MPAYLNALAGEACTS